MSIPLVFDAYTSNIDPSFWAQFYKNKLELYKLDETGIPILLSYTTSPHVSLPPKISAYGEYSYNPAHKLGPQTCGAPGTLLNFNSFDKFKSADKQAILQEYAGKIWEDMLTMKVLHDPALLARSFIISFADLKTHLYTYWLNTPTLLLPSLTMSIANAQPLGQFFPEFQWNNAFSQTFPDITNHNVVIFNQSTQKLVPFHHLVEYLRANIAFSLVMVDPSPKNNEIGWYARNLLLFYVIVSLYAHTTTHDRKETSALETIHLSLICLKNFRDHAADTHESYVYNIDISNLDTIQADVIDYMIAAVTPAKSQTTHHALPPLPSVVGWEKRQGRYKPRQVSLQSLMSPIKIYNQAVDMNLKLLKWQHWPDMPLDLIRSYKCLLIGSGTLGCYVSRLLLGWGIQNITMLDYGKVSASNPVRQPLYTYEDWQQGRLKAYASRDALLKILPDANIRGEVLSIPNAGNVAPTELPQAIYSAYKLHHLVKSHDVVFLLTDSRASRWLPTLLAQVHQKLTITAAIGADSYVSLRHGVRAGWVPPQSFESAPAPEDQPPKQDSGRESASSVPSKSIEALTNQDFPSPAPPPAGDMVSCGCYYCPDTVAPVLAVPQSIDQQCTVTRAEVAALTSAYAVNLFIQHVTHHCSFTTDGDTANTPEIVDVPEPDSDEDTNSNSKSSSHKERCSCTVNTQIRGDVNTPVTTDTLTCPPSQHCIACGVDIVTAYINDPLGFLTSTLTDADNVTLLSGAPNYEDDQYACDWDIGDDDDDDF